MGLKKEEDLDRGVGGMGELYISSLFWDFWNFLTLQRS